MKTYKVFYHDRDIFIEADDMQFSDNYAIFFKGGSKIAYVPKSCPFTIIAVK